MSELKLFIDEADWFLRVHIKLGEWINLYKITEHTYEVESWHHDDDERSGELKDVLSSIPGIAIKDNETVIIDDECMVLIRLKYGTHNVLI